MVAPRPKRASTAMANVESAGQTANISVRVQTGSTSIPLLGIHCELSPDMGPLMALLTSHASEVAELAPVLRKQRETDAGYLHSPKTPGCPM